MSWELFWYFNGDCEYCGVWWLEVKVGMIMVMLVGCLDLGSFYVLIGEFLIGFGGFDVVLVFEVVVRWLD